MALEGYVSITSVDYAPSCIDRMAAAHAAAFPGLSYAVADARALPYGDGAFATVLDKGTLDALLCGDSAEADAAALLAEAVRVLAPGGSYIMVTSAAPPARLALLQAAGGSGRWEELMVYEVGQQGALGGPYCSRTQAAEVARLPRERYSHFAYVCVRGSGGGGGGGGA
jgi:SAM-dependent methyltransferase